MYAIKFTFLSPSSNKVFIAGFSLLAALNVSCAPYNTKDDTPPGLPLPRSSNQIIDFAGPEQLVMDFVQAVVGMKYRRLILEPSDSRDALAMVREFLGREPNNKALVKDLGLEVD